MVKKHYGSWRMCINYSNLDNACPKDHYPLPEIDPKVESMEGFQLKCFLDTYKGYHQVKMRWENEEKTVFHINRGTYCYQKMPSSLKNASTTYQCLMDKVFEERNGKNVEVYVDDMVIKSRNEETLLQDAEETLQTLAQAQMKLNQVKIQEFFDSKTPYNI
uniref:Reverse transcriptase domain-containing protein n=1 Tax=Lactuca sativa TaxID=4236 RepID=A0A9R1WAB3_LACSA|nr:hypothetical protein LSAT_V11C300130530 [Lactuca sativa]